MKRVMKAVLGLGFFLSSYMSFGQVTAESMRTMFSEPGSVQWVRHMTGDYNAVHPVDFWLATDGTTYRGVMDFEADELTFEFEGSIDNGKLVLQEIDEKGLITGYVNGILRDDRFSGRWWSADLSRSAELRLLDDGLVLLEKFEPSLTVYHGNAGKRQFELFIWFEAPDVLSGIIMTDSTCTRVFGVCADEFCREITLEITSGPFERATLKSKGSGKYDVLASGDFGSQSGTCTEVQHYDIHRGGALDYSFIADYSYPIIDKGYFDQWISDKLKTWYSAYQTLSDTRVQSGPSTRWMDFASAWVDIFMIRDGLISGLITATEPGTDDYLREAFVYDVDKGRLIGYDEMTKKEVDLVGALRNEISGDDTAGYHYPVVTSGGFAFCTEFDVVQGDSIQLVPFSAIQHQLRMRSTFTKLAD